MKLSFFGADHEVTGSCHFLEACGKKIMIDCGMQQGPDEYDNQDIPVSPADVDYVLLTHAHMDHSGRLPLLTKMGFKGKIYSTFATKELCHIMLRDSAHIQEFEAEWKNRKKKRAGEKLIEPLYTNADAEQTLNYFETYSYGQVIPVCPGIKIRFIDVGHLLGSASIEVWVEENGINKKIVFSGDIGNINQPLIKDPAYITEADYVVMESTYGDRNHNAPADYQKNLVSVIQKTFDRGGNVVIPSFAVGRTQEMLYFLRDIIDNNLIKGHAGFSVYVDSPLAVEATNIFNENVKGYYDDEAMALVSQGINPIRFPGLKISVTPEESKAINEDNQCKVIISSSGMCEAGRIRHHLKHNLWRPECTVIFVGYQGEGTLGRLLLEGAKTVKLFGETITVKADIVELPGISGHADQSGLIRWIKAFDKKPERVFIVHGDSTICDSFAKLLHTDYSFETTAPNFKSSYDLVTDTCTDIGLAPTLKMVEKSNEKQQTKVLLRLKSASERLLSIIKRREETTNSDSDKFAEQINELCEKWDK